MNYRTVVMLKTFCASYKSGVLVVTLCDDSPGCRSAGTAVRCGHTDLLAQDSNASWLGGGVASAGRPNATGCWLRTLMRLGWEAVSSEAVYSAMQILISRNISGGTVDLPRG